MSKHTPGPWEVMTWESDSKSRKRKRTYVMSNGISVAILGATGRTDKEVDTNARLIAAAPDLLKGLKEVFDLIDSGFLVRNIDRDAEPDWAVRQLKPLATLRDALAAIAKAEGRE